MLLFVCRCVRGSLFTIYLCAKSLNTGEGNGYQFYRPCSDLADIIEDIE